MSLSDNKEEVRYGDFRRVGKKNSGLRGFGGDQEIKSPVCQLADEKYRNGMPRGEKDLERIAGEMVQLFTEDAVWDGGEFGGKLTGRKQIFERFKGANFRFGVHYFLMPHITVKGNSAEGRWYMWMVGTMNDGTRVWVVGFEDDEYRKINGQWFKSNMKFTRLFLAPYDKGWF